MIPKGNQRSGGQQLATHLLNSFDNDNVEVAEVRGAIAQDLHGAFAEWYAQSKTTDCVKYLYSLSINPDHRQGKFNRDHYYDFIRRTEKSLGLGNQPRAVVFHVKYGREHCHVVWSRIDAEKGKAVQLSHDRQKLRAVAQSYARAHNLTLPPGMQNDRGAARFAFKAAAENLTEKQQQDRSGISKEQRREQITKLWNENPDARSFVKSLEANGYFLANGDKRDYVVIDTYGEVHSLSRQLIGVKAKELKTRLSEEYPADQLPGVEKAQAFARERRQELVVQNGKKPRDGQPTPDERRQVLAEDHAQRRAVLETERQKLADRHAAERMALSEMQAARTEQIARDRAGRQPKGIAAFLSRVTGFDALTAFRQNWQDRKREKEHGLQSAALARKHEREMDAFKHREHGLTSVEQRERRSLETKIRRDIFSRIAAPQKTATNAPERALDPAQLERARKLAADFRRASAPKTPTPELKPAFTEAAQLPTKADAEPAKPAPESLAEKFNPAAENKEAPQPEAEGGGGKKRAEELTTEQKRALDLAEEFKRAARPHKKDLGKDRGGKDRNYRQPPPDYYSFRR